MNSKRWLNRAAGVIRPRIPDSAATQSQQENDAHERAFTRRVVDLAMRVAETMLTVGASVNDVTLAALQIVKAYGVTPVHVDVTYTSITVSYGRGADDDPLTVTRVIRGRTTDSTRLQRLVELTSEIEDGLSIDQARARFAEVSTAAHPYRRAVIVLANGAIAAGVAILMGATAIITFAALVAAMLITITHQVLGKRLFPTFFAQALGALIVTAIAIVLNALHGEVDWIGDVRPSIIVSAGIVVMLAGMSFVGSAQDAIDGYYVTAGARVFEVLLLTLGIVIGITVGLQLGARLGYGMLLPSSAPDNGPLHQQLIGVVIIGGAYALSTYASPRAVALACGMGFIGYVAYLAGIWAQLGPAASTGIGALVSSFLAILVAKKLRVPALTLTTAAIVPLVPGAAIFRGLLQLTQADGSTAAMMNGASTLLGAAGVAIAIAAGVSLGAFFGRPTRDTIATAARRMRRDST